LMLHSRGCVEKLRQEARDETLAREVRDSMMFAAGGHEKKRAREGGVVDGHPIPRTRERGDRIRLYRVRGNSRGQSVRSGVAGQDLKASLRAFCISHDLAKWGFEGSCTPHPLGSAEVLPGEGQSSKWPYRRKKIKPSLQSKKKKIENIFRGSGATVLSIQRG